MNTIVILKQINLLQVVLLYKKTRHTPTIWFCSRNYDFHFLADDFTTYMRMAIAHLGILQWQMAHVGLRTTEASSVRTLRS